MLLQRSECPRKVVIEAEHDAGLALCVDKSTASSLDSFQPGVDYVYCLPLVFPAVHLLPSYGRYSTRTRFWSLITPNYPSGFCKPVMRFTIGRKKFSPIRPSATVSIMRSKPCRYLRK